MYRPSLWEPLSIIVIVLSIALILVVPYITRKKILFQEKSKKYTLRIKYFSLLITRMLNLITRANSRKFFVAFIISALLMISLGFVAGPDPRHKVYAISSPETTEIIDNILNRRLDNVQVISPQDTISEFGTLSNIGTFQAVIVSDYPDIGIPRLSRHVLDNLQLIPVIIMDKDVDKPFADAIRARYEEKIIDIDSIQDLDSLEIRDQIIRFKRNNPVGLSVDIQTFKIVASIVGALSFVLVLLGVAFLVRRILEIGQKTTLLAFAEVIGFSVLVFLFCEAIYMSSSVLLNWPLSLHAVTSGSREITAIGTLGFGGGSRPRLLFGILGALIGSYPFIRKSSRFSWIGFSAFLITFFIIVLDPLTGGDIFYEFALLYTGGPSFGIANESLFGIKDFLSSIGVLMGGWSSSVYGLSTGKELFFAGVIPLAFISRLNKSTSTFLLLASIFMFANGVVRVGEMTAFKTFASMMPGFIAGFVITLPFIALSSIEGILRRKFGRR
jgi:hypothetical protein